MWFYSKKYTQSVSLNGSGSQFGSIYKSELTIISDDTTIVRTFTPNISQSTFNSTLTGAPATLYNSIHSTGGQAMVEFSFYDNLGSDCRFCNIYILSVDL